MTLIKSNPSFKKERALFFYKSFNSKNKTIEEVEIVFRKVDLLCNAINEKTGKNIDAEEMYLMVIGELNDYTNDFSNIDLPELYNQIEKILFNYPPTLYCLETKNILDKLKELSKSPFNILSNTAFIKGGSLKIILDHLSISSYFDFQIYSDEVGISKPNKLIFEMAIEKAKLLHPDNNFSASDILHIGDNVVADIGGAILTGLDTFQINTNNKSISNIFE